MLRQHRLILLERSTERGAQIFQMRKCSRGRRWPSQRKLALRNFCLKSVPSRVMTRHIS
jgi:hypothetical protein